MTFLLLPAWAAWLLIAAAAAAAAALFAMRPRPAQHLVASLVIWQRVLDEAQARPWRDRARWLVSLALTLAIAVAIAAAIARPAPAAGAGRGARLLLVLDSSWTLNARTATGETRWARAVAAARRLAADWRGSDIAIASTSGGVVQGPTPERALVKRALDELARLTPAGGGEAAGWPAVADATAVAFITDGAVPRALPAGITVHSVFEPAPNVAITAFDVQPGARPGAPASLFLAAANYAAEPQAVRLAVARGAEVLFDRTVEIAAGATHRNAMTIPAGGDARFRADVRAPLNALAVDDHASAWLGAAAPLRVAIVGAPGQLPSLLSHDAGLSVTLVPAAEYARARADVWVFNQWLPNEPPAEPALIIDPPPAAWLGRRGPEETSPVFAATAGTRGGTGHPLLDGVDTALVALTRARAVLTPSLQTAAESERETPLVAVEDSRARRLVVLAFALDESNLAATPAFPVLVGNALEWLGRPAADLHLTPGRTTLPAGTVRVLGPDGRPVQFARLEDRVTALLAAPGLYLLQTSGGQRVLRVTLGDMRPSNLLETSVPATAPSSSPAKPATSEAAPSPDRSWWSTLAFAAFVLAALEWLTWQRRLTV